MSDHRPRGEFRTALGEWFVSELTDSEAPSPAETNHPIPAVVAAEFSTEPASATSSRRWVAYAASLLVLGGLLVPLLVNLRAEAPDSRSSATEPARSVDVADDLDSVCLQFAAAVPELVVGASRAAVSVAVEGFVATLDELATRVDQIGEAASGVEQHDLGTRLRIIRDRVAQLPSLVGSTVLDRSIFDSEVSNIDILVIDVGRSMSSLGAEGCQSLPTMWEQP
jgi:hypothetical protein